MALDPMPQNKLETPILFLIFNRFETTKKVFESIKEAKPTKLYIARDGARKGKEGEAAIVKNITEFVIQNIDWECEVNTLFREENLGCKNAISSALCWFFENEERGIILEDDCLPSQSFYPYCQELLEKYKDDTRVAQICGTNMGCPTEQVDPSYFFSRHGFIWGWATWKRTWELYDIKMKNLEKVLQSNQLRDNIFSNDEIDTMEEEYRAVQSGKIDTWDYQLSFTRYSNNMYSIIPKANMISNIGFDENATHTKDTTSDLSELKLEQTQKIIHPDYFLKSNTFDNAYSRRKKKSLLQKVKNFIKLILQREGR